MTRPERGAVHHSWRWPCGFLLIVVLIIPLDAPLTSFCHSLIVDSNAFENFTSTAEAFGHGYAIILILLTVAIADERRGWSVLPTFAIVFGAGLAASLIKVMTVRIRPNQLDLSVVNGWETFHGPWHLLDVPMKTLSFPSGHATVVFALAYVFSRYYPRGRPMFLLIAMCSAFGRVASLAHFASDSLAGAVLGWSFAMVASRYLITDESQFDPSDVQPVPSPIRNGSGAASSPDSDVKQSNRELIGTAGDS